MKRDILNSYPQFSYIYCLIILFPLNNNYDKLTCRKKQQAQFNQRKIHVFQCNLTCVTIIAMQGRERIHDLEPLFVQKKCA